jgi:hypothetical protein
MADTVVETLAQNADLRQGCLSVGVPILMPDGVTLVCVRREDAEHDWERTVWQIGPETVERWARHEWLDLRHSNMELWRRRLLGVLERARREASADSSSRFERTFSDPATWEASGFDIGEIAAWVFIHEDDGRRLKS